MKQLLYGTITLALSITITLLLSQCKTSDIAINKAELKKVKTVAIMRFEAIPGIHKEVARECEESFRGNFVEAGFNVVEREKLKLILKEAEISQTGITEQSIQLGKMLGAEALVFGEVTKNESQVRLVTYSEYIKEKDSRRTIRIEKTKNKIFFNFQIHIRVISAETGNTILTLKNKYPESDYEMTSSMTLDKYREKILSQMGDDLKSAVED